MSTHFLHTLQPPSEGSRTKHRIAHRPACDGATDIACNAEHRISTFQPAAHRARATVTRRGTSNVSRSACLTRARAHTCSGVRAAALASCTFCTSVLSARRPPRTHSAVHPKLASLSECPRVPMPLTVPPSVPPVGTLLAKALWRGQLGTITCAFAYPPPAAHGMLHVAHLRATVYRTLDGALCIACLHVLRCTLHAYVRMVCL